MNILVRILAPKTESLVSGRDARSSFPSLTLLPCLFFSLFFEICQISSRETPPFNEKKNLLPISRFSNMANAPASRVVGHNPLDRVPTVSLARQVGRALNPKVRTMSKLQCGCGVLSKDFIDPTIDLPSPKVMCRRSQMHLVPGPVSME